MRAKGFSLEDVIESNCNCTSYDPNLIGLMISRLERYIINPQNPPSYPEKRRHRLTTRVETWLDLCVMSVMRYV